MVLDNQKLTFFCEHLIEVGHIDLVTNGRDEVWLDLFLHQPVPVHIIKPSMVLDLALVLSSNSLHWILLQQGKDQVFALIRDISFAVVKEEFAVDDVLEHLLVVSVVEGRRTVDHFEDENAEGPPVSHEGLSLACYYLRAYIANKVLT